MLMMMIKMDIVNVVQILNGIQTLKFVMKTALNIVKIAKDLLLEGAKNVLMAISKHKTFVYHFARLDILKVQKFVKKETLPFLFLLLIK